jgi:hypothetical protein
MGFVRGVENNCLVLHPWCRACGLSGLVVLLAFAGVVPHARASQAPRTITGAKLARLVRAQPNLTLTNVRVTGSITLQGTYGLTLRNATVLGPILLNGHYRFIADHVTFEDDLDGNVEAAEEVNATRSTFKGAFSFVSGQGACQRAGRSCHLTASGDRDVFREQLAFVVENGSRFDFIRSTFETFALNGDYTSISCFKCTYTSPVHMEGIHARRLEFGTSEFRRPVLLLDSRIDDLEVEDTDFKAAVDLTGSAISTFGVPCVRGQAVYIAWSQFGERWLRAQLKRIDRSTPTGRTEVQRLLNELSCWKDDLSQIGHDRDSLKAHRAAARLERSITAKCCWDWISSWALEIRDGYGTEPWRPVLISAGIILLFAILYVLGNPFTAEQPRSAISKGPLPLFALGYSLETFIPVFTVTGIKKWGWRIDSGWRWVEVIEALLGAVFTLLSAYSVGSHLL